MASSGLSPMMAITLVLLKQNGIPFVISPDSTACGIALSENPEGGYDSCIPFDVRRVSLNAAQTKWVVDGTYEHNPSPQFLVLWVLDDPTLLLIVPAEFYHLLDRESEPWRNRSTPVPLDLGFCVIRNPDFPETIRRIRECAIDQNKAYVNPWTGTDLGAGRFKAVKTTVGSTTSNDEKISGWLNACPLRSNDETAMASTNSISAT
jgi:hypothetical protein